MVMEVARRWCIAPADLMLEDIGSGEGLISEYTGQEE